MHSVAGLLGCVLLSGALAAAQTAAPVPTDHYGPPACPAGTSSSHRMTVDAARAEQEQGGELVHAIPSVEPFENFGLDRYRLANYGDCMGQQGCYWADLDTQYRRAELALDTELAAHHGGGKLAVVFDIDETALSNYCEMRREDFGYIPSMQNQWTFSRESAVAIPGALRLYAKARAAGVAVFFITGRPGMADPGAPSGSADQTAATAQNLKLAGFQDWRGLRLRNRSERTMPTIMYKSEERQKIVDAGYTILLSVGDQWSDLLGKPQADVSIKLPNPFYFIP